MLGVLGIVGLYSLYLLYLGLPRLMRVAEDKAIGYVVRDRRRMIVVYAVVIVAGRVACWSWAFVRADDDDRPRRSITLLIEQIGLDGA